MPTPVFLTTRTTMLTWSLFLSLLSSSTKMMSLSPKRLSTTSCIRSFVNLNLKSENHQRCSRSSGALYSGVGYHLQHHSFWCCQTSQSRLSHLLRLATMESAQSLEYNVDKAKQLLAQAGVSNLLLTHRSEARIRTSVPFRMLGPDWRCAT